jgi:hypothetical protein
LLFHLIDRQTAAIAGLDSQWSRNRQKFRNSFH